MSVCCVGECMMELVELPDRTLTRGFGGDTLNTALYLARLGVPTDYVTALGADGFSDEMVRAWSEEGIGTGHVLRLPGRLPGLYLIQTDELGERRFFYWRDAAPVRLLFNLPETPQVQAVLTAAELIYLSGITLSLFDEESRNRLFETLDIARRHGCLVAFDTNFRTRGWPDIHAARAVYDRMFRHSDIVLASVEDHFLLQGSAAADDLIARLHAADVREMVVKLAHPAAYVAAGKDSVVVEAEPVDSVVDTTAAGDSFAAGYIAARRAGMSPEHAARIGHQLAGAVVRHRGAIIPRDAMPAIVLGAPTSATP
ncbi:MAG TPA: sugar kinase [Acidisphaera sp.]|nr:sugar kinase [Acidisphaera sp.]